MRCGCCWSRRLLAEAVHHLHVHYRLGPLYRNRGVPDASDAIREHTAIIAAIAARDAVQAERLMRQHVARSGAMLRPWAEMDTPQDTQRRAAPSTGIAKQGAPA
jgi:DNA-binding GntR family transcriptional regulator